MIDHILMFFRNDDEDYLAGKSDRVTHVRGIERAWTPWPSGPRTFEENLELLEQSRRRRAKRDAAA